MNESKRHGLSILIVIFKAFNIFGWVLLEVVNRSMVKVKNDPGSLTLTHGLQEGMISKSCVSFEEECTITLVNLATANYSESGPLD